MKSSTEGGAILALAILLLLGGFALSTLYWTVTDAPAFLAIQEDYSAAVMTAGDAAGSIEPAPVVAALDHWETVAAAARIVEAHGHFLFICTLLVLFAALVEETRIGTGAAWLMPSLAAGGVIIYPAGLIAQAKISILAGQILAAVGATMIIVFVAVVVWRIFRSSSHDDQSAS